MHFLGSSSSCVWSQGGAGLPGGARELASKGLGRAGRGRAILMEWELEPLGADVQHLPLS
jgi:hypothetical protein